MPVPPSLSSSHAPSPSLLPTFTPADPHDTVYFTVTCQPRTSISVEEFRARLAAGDIDELLPEPAALATVVQELRLRHFDVVDQTVSPIVIASGPASLFQSVFTNVRLTRMVHPAPYEGSEPEPATVLVRGSEEPDARVIPGALIVSVPEPPRLSATSNTTTGSAFCLDLHNGVAGRIGALAAAALKKPFRPPVATHPWKQRVRVAVVDTGFAAHNFFTPFEPHITRLPSNTALDPEVDVRHHGTLVLANLLACAPTVEVYAVKYHKDIPAALTVALGVPGVRLLSLSWDWDVESNPDYSSVEGIRLQIQHAVSRGVTVIVAAGNDSNLTFPALMSAVVAVGGVGIDASGDSWAWPRSAAFHVSSRTVPDLCGIASQINMPWPFNGDTREMQCRNGETSCATPQVAAVASLLYEKNGSLSPLEVKYALMLSARDVVGGHAYSGAAAVIGPDAATGRGLVDAVASWHVVP